MQTIENLILESKKLTKEIETLSRRVLLLEYLEAYGVDNWNGYEDAVREWEKDVDSDL